MKDYMGSVSRVQAWVRDYGEAKQVQFIADINTICDALLEKEESPPDSPASPVQQLKAKIAPLAKLLDRRAESLEHKAELHDIAERLEQLSAV